jgi:hypothetical protein
MAIFNSYVKLPEGMCMAMKQWLLGVFFMFGGRKWKELLDISVTFSSC